MIRVVIADDQSLFLESLELYLKNSDDIDVAATTLNGEEAVELAEKLKPDILLLDLKMPGLGGLEAAARIKSVLPEIKIAVITTFEDETDILKAFSLRLEGYLVKDIKPGDLILALRSIHRGLFVMHHSAYETAGKFIAANLESVNITSPSEKVKSFSVQEEKIIRLISSGKSNKEIAVELDYTEGTIKNYISRILQKTGCRDRTHLAVYAIKKDLA